ncbi:MAG: heavy-metal-associated domain-containing protein [Nitrospirota bacterium]|jgi:copper chaperone CopZ
MWKLIQTTMLVGTMTLSLFGLQGFAAESQKLQTVTLQIDGMTCGGCVRDVKTALTKVPSVNSVEITVGKKGLFFLDYTDVRAAVIFDSDKTGVAALIKTVESASTALSTYKARVLKE